MASVVWKYWFLDHITHFIQYMTPSQELVPPMLWMNLPPQLNISHRLLQKYFSIITLNVFMLTMEIKHHTCVLTKYQLLLLTEENGIKTETLWMLCHWDFCSISSTMMEPTRSLASSYTVGRILKEGIKKWESLNFINPLLLPLLRVSWNLQVPIVFQGWKEANSVKGPTCIPSSLLSIPKSKNKYFPWTFSLRKNIWHF